MSVHPSSVAALAVTVAKRLGAAQRRVVLSLTRDDWGPSADHRVARTMFWGVKGGHYLVNHKHRTDNCWCLTELGVQVKGLLIAELTA